MSIGSRRALRPDEWDAAGLMRAPGADGVAAELYNRGVEVPAIVERLNASIRAGTFDARSAWSELEYQHARLGAAPAADPAVPEPQVDKAIEFLKQLQPDQRWSLAAIEPLDKDGTIVTRLCPMPEDVRAFVREYGALGWNIYYQPNPVHPSLGNGRASKKNIMGALVVHTEVDPPKDGTDIAAWQSEMRAAFDGWSLEVPPPSVIVFSGGGYQFLWLLAEPTALMTVDETRTPQAQTDWDAVEQIESRNRRLVELLDADPAATDVSRLLRLPGTYNFPSPKKIARGRTGPVLAEVVRFDQTRRYALDAFPAAPTKAKVSATTIAPSDRVTPERLAELVRDEHLRKQIVEGAEPGADRSKFAFSAVCQLIRAGVDDPTIAAIIGDPAYKVSAHNLDQHDVQRAIDRAIASAHAQVDPEMHLFDKVREARQNTTSAPAPDGSIKVGDHSKLFDDYGADRTRYNRIVSTLIQRNHDPAVLLSKSADELLALYNQNPAPLSVLVRDVVAEIRAKSNEPVATTPWERFNETTDGLTLGSTNVLIGFQGSGKSSFAAQLGAHHAEQPDCWTVYYLGEMNARLVAARIIGQRTNRNWKDVLRGKLSDDEMRAVLDPLRLRIVPRHHDPIAAMRQTVADVRSLEPNATILLVVDYVQLLATVRADMRVSNTEAVRALQTLIEDEHLVGVVLSQTSRGNSKRIREGAEDSIDLADTGAETAELERSATLQVVLSYQQKDDTKVHEVTLAITKRRFGGPTKMYMDFNGESGVFRERSSPVKTKAEQDREDAILEALRVHEEGTCGGAENSRCVARMSLNTLHKGFGAPRLHKVSANKGTLGLTLKRLETEKKIAKVGAEYQIARGSANP